MDSENIRPSRETRSLLVFGGALTLIGMHLGGATDKVRDKLDRVLGLKPSEAVAADEAPQLQVFAPHAHNPSKDILPPDPSALDAPTTPDTSVVDVFQK